MTRYPVVPHAPTEEDAVNGVPFEPTAHRLGDDIPLRTVLPVYDGISIDGVIISISGIACLEKRS